jgi:hypothetical protein
LGFAIELSPSYKTVIAKHAYFGIFSILGAWFFGLGMYYMAQSLESLYWPTSTGNVITSQVDTRISTGPHGGVAYTLNLVYNYAVNGKTYTVGHDTGVAPGMWVNNSSAAYGLVEAFPVGNHPKVFYSPSNPSESFLLPGVHWFTFIWPDVGLIFLSVASGFGLVIYWVSRHPWPDDLGRLTTNPNQGEVPGYVVLAFVACGFFFFGSIIAFLLLMR